MKYLTLEYIKSHSKIDFDCEDSLLELYGGSAEKRVLKLLGCTLDELKEDNDGEVPEPIMHATLLIVDNAYKHRSPGESTNLSDVPWGIDSMLLPYMVL